MSERKSSAIATVIPSIVSSHCLSNRNNSLRYPAAGGVLHRSSQHNADTGMRFAPCDPDRTLHTKKAVMKMPPRGSILVQKHTPDMQRMAISRSERREQSDCAGKKRLNRNLQPVQIVIETFRHVAKSSADPNSAAILSSTDRVQPWPPMPRCAMRASRLSAGAAGPSAEWLQPHRGRTSSMRHLQLKTELVNHPHRNPVPAGADLSLLDRDASLAWFNRIGRGWPVSDLLSKQAPDQFDGGACGTAPASRKGLSSTISQIEPARIHAASPSPDAPPGRSRRPAPSCRRRAPRSDRENRDRN